MVAAGEGRTPVAGMSGTAVTSVAVEDTAEAVEGTVEDIVAGTAAVGTAVAGIAAAAAGQTKARRTRRAQARGRCRRRRPWFSCPKNYESVSKARSRMR